MDHEAQDHRIARLLDRPSHGELVLEGVAAGDEVVLRLFARLEAQLDMVEPGLAKCLNARLVHAKARGDQVGVVTERPGVGDQGLEVAADQGLAAREAELGGPHRAGLRQHPPPLLGGQLRLDPREIHGVGAIGALQRAGVGQLGEQPERLRPEIPIETVLTSAPSRCHVPSPGIFPRRPRARPPGTAAPDRR